MVFKAFSDLTMYELCTPVVYGSEKDAIALRNALGLQINVNKVKQAEDIQDGKLNLVDCVPENAQERAAADCQSGMVDALVLIEAKTSAAQQRVMANEHIRIALPSEPWTTESLTEKAKQFRDILRRDFMLSTPRIALMAANARQGDGSWGREEEEIVKPAVAALMEENIPVFGPYDSKAFAEHRIYEQFDGIVAFTKEQALELLNATEDAHAALIMSGLPYVATMIRPNSKSCPKPAGEENVEGQTLRNAIYLALDVLRRRVNYDRPYRNPLQKLYHEKKDESEKVRFAIPKAKSEKKDNQKEENSKEEAKPAE